ncbi:MAG TPA: GatB/YqeY domain-containing protein [Rhizomicrobium sp.]|nr:GatB/YqeY domain-containing protein [Rhizomicrobium sp.]
MGLRDEFNAAMKEAMKAKQQRRLSTIRLILAALKDRDIANRSEESREGIGDDEIRLMLGKMIKQREESVATYEQGGRPELAAAEREEIVIIRGFLPKQMSDSEVEAAAKAAIAEVGATSMKEMGKVIATMKERYAGQMDFAKASGMVKGLLTPPK